MADVTLHIDENTTHTDREDLRDRLLSMDGVEAAAYHDEKPHLMIVEYEPERVEPVAFLNAARDLGLHAELVGL